METAQQSTSNSYNNNPDSDLEVLEEFVTVEVNREEFAALQEIIPGAELLHSTVKTDTKREK